MFSFMNRGDTMALPLDGRQSFSRAVFRARETHAGGPGREEPPDERPASGEGSRLPRTPHVKGYSLWRIFTAVGGLIMIISFFTPWWGMRIDVRGTQVGDETALRREATQYGLLRQDHAEFHNRRFSGSQLNRFNRPLDQPIGGAQALRAWGWDFGRGIVTLVFGILVLAVALVVVFVPIMRYLAWTGMLPAALLGLIVIIISLTVWIGTPGENMLGSYLRFRQGVHVGPFLAMLGGLLALVGGLIDGLINVTWHHRRRRRIVA